jgi:hypothetical protein
MKCKICEDRLLEYLYGELSDADAAAMEKHLEASEECRQAAEAFASVLDTVTGAEEEEGPPPALHTRIMGHAEEAGSKRRSIWAWVFRPAVTTAMIGAIAAGVYFATLRHKPPSYRDERLVFERLAPAEKADLLEKEEQVPAFPERLAEKPAAVAEGRAVPEPKEHVQKALKKPAPQVIASPSGREERPAAAYSADEEVSLQRDTPPPTIEKAHLPERQEEVHALGERSAEDFVVLNEGRAVPEPKAPEQEALKKSAPRRVARPSVQEEQSIAAYSMDKEVSSEITERKDKRRRAEADRIGAAPPSATERRARFGVTGFGSATGSLNGLKKKAPGPIEGARDLAAKGDCAEAEEQFDAYFAEHPKEEACGAGWLEVASCFLKKGDTEAARKAAEKALEIPAYTKEAQAFLDSLPQPAE